MSDEQQELPITDEQSTMVEKPEQPKGALIYAAISDVMLAIGPIAKSQRNEQQKYNFRGIEQVVNACHPIFAKHGVFSTSTILDSKTESRESVDKHGKPRTIVHAIVQMRYTFHTRDGSSVSTEVQAEGIDYNGDKASNKAMSAAQKYALLQLLQIPTAMVDSDRPEAPNPEDIPTRNENAPEVQPRGKREPAVTKKQVVLLLEEWKKTANVPTDKDEAKAAWFQYVKNTCERHIHPGAIDQWTQADYHKVRADLGIPSEEELPQ